MQEATSELNVTVVVAIIVGVFIAFFATVIWPMIKTGYKVQVDCDEAICVCNNIQPDGTCAEAVDGKIDCTIRGSSQTIKCAWKG